MSEVVRELGPTPRVGDTDTIVAVYLMKKLAEGVGTVDKYVGEPWYIKTYLSLDLFDSETDTKPPFEQTLKLLRDNFERVGLKPPYEPQIRRVELEMDDGSTQSAVAIVVVGRKAVAELGETKESPDE